MWRIGLTGGIGSGKSTVLARLALRGAGVVDADAISRAVTAVGGVAIEPLRVAFGSEFIDPHGALDRVRMRALVFGSPVARRRLESIIHPLVGRATQAEVDSFIREGRPCLVFDIPLLVESGRWRHQLDRVLVIDCSEATQIERVQARDGRSEAEIRAILDAQASRALRLRAADLVICNDALGLHALHQQVDAVAARFGL